jgi:hypothetical protein
MCKRLLEDVPAAANSFTNSAVFSVSFKSSMMNTTNNLTTLEISKVADNVLLKLARKIDGPPIRALQVTASSAVPQVDSSCISV